MSHPILATCSSNHVSTLHRLPPVIMHVFSGVTSCDLAQSFYWVMTDKIIVAYLQANSSGYVLRFRGVILKGFE